MNVCGELLGVESEFARQCGECVLAEIGVGLSILEEEIVILPEGPLLRGGIARLCCEFGIRAEDVHVPPLDS